jgi:hypothetical protein
MRTLKRCPEIGIIDSNKYRSKISSPDLTRRKMRIVRVCRHRGPSRASPRFITDKLNKPLVFQMGTMRIVSRIADSDW